MSRLNKKTDCWECGQTFGEPIEIGIIDGKILTTYHEDDILCTDCMDTEQLVEGSVSQSR